MPEIRFNGIRVRYEYLPALTRPKGNIVLLHDISLNMHDADPIIPFLQLNFNVLRYDLPGHGQSELPQEDYQPLDLTVNQLAFMSRHFFRKPFYIVANNGYGFTASRFCRSHGSLVAGLIVISPQPVYLSGKEKEGLVNQILEKSAVSYDHYKQFILSNLTVKKDAASMAKLKSLFDQTSKQSHFKVINAIITEDYIEDFKHIDVPLLVLAGSEDRLFPPSLNGVSAHIMGAQFRIIPGASHLAAFDNPEAAASEIHRFIADTERGNTDEAGLQLNNQEITAALYRGFEHMNTTQRLSVHLMHTFRVQIGELEVTKGWNHRKIKSLLLYLLFHRTVSREELMDKLWPDLVLNKARNQLRMNLHYLSTVLRTEEGFEYLHRDREHVFLQGDIWCDATSYLQELKEACSQALIGDLDLNRGKHIVEIFPHKMLTHLYEDWYLEMRESMETQYCSLCSWIACKLRDLHQEDAAAAYERKAMQLLE
ncbi:alpha/beta hydrolase [Paenibacillus sp. HB172176]|uniref:alpha/beta hydrolase n=1 Tax=Paenibacillus sp. HB172176 TaxID=2493690 RepID=UPI00143BC2C5|nr:alpha/beta hydrolase [Paenibacillus sp. HB172176]